MPAFAGMTRKKTREGGGVALFPSPNGASLPTIQQAYGTRRIKTGKAMPDISPQLLLDAVMGHFQTSAIKAAVELDLFTAIGEGAHDAGAIAKRTGAAERGIEILADYLTVLGFL